MPKTRGSAVSTSKWVKNTSQATDSYVQGIQSPRTPWKQATTAAAGNYEQGVTQAVQQKRFTRGVTQTPDGKQEQASVTKGAQRFAPGVQLAQSDYDAGITRVLNTIEAVALPPRKAKGDPSNLNRIAPITTALHAMKTGQNK